MTVDKIIQLKKTWLKLCKKYKGKSYSCYSGPWEEIHYARIAFEKACIEYGESLERDK